MTTEHRPSILASHRIRTAIHGLSKPLKWSLVALRRPLESRSTGSAWGKALDHVIQELEDLNGSTERDFLAVGEKLAEFRATARQISSDSAALTELISGEHGSHGSHALTRMLAHAKGLDARIEQSGQALAEVRDLSSRIRGAFAGLRNTVSIFHTLCTLTRIETSRLGNAGSDFADLAAEVRPLSESIQLSGEGVLQASSRLEQGVQSAIENASHLRVKQLRELPALIAGVMGSLRSFAERQQRAAESSVRQTAQYEALCGAVDGVVTSIQFHDITRQQIEHVVQALRQLRSIGGGRGNPDSLPPGGGAVLALQSSQLSGAAAVFAVSIERMEHDLESIAARAQDMAEVSRALMGISADEQDSFFLGMESQCTAILKMLGACTTAQAKMESTGAGLAETIGGMRASIAEIRGIEIQIQRIAINATIRSTHIGAAGNALSVIADAMQRLAFDSNTNTEDVARALDGMSDAAGRVSHGFGVAAAEPSNGSEIAEEMRRTILELHSSSESSYSRVSQIAASGARLLRDIAAVRGGLSAGALVAGVVDRARAELERIGAQAGPASLEAAEVAPIEQLESLTRRYTMQMERDVHESVARGSAVPPTPTAAPEAALPDGDFGDNVELF
jgi:methyl-accepting chemotaxis protein